MAPEGIIRSMKQGGVKEPWALLNAAGWKEGDSEETTKDKLSEFQKARKKHRRKKHLAGR
jgi:hypothetical protein